MHKYRLILFSLLIPACTGGSGEKSPDSDATPSPGAEHSDAGPELLTVDCATIPDVPSSVRTMPGARGYHGLLVTEEGKLLGSNGSSVISSSYAGETSLFATNTGLGEQMAFLPDGDIVMQTDDGHLTRITSTGSQSTLSPKVGAYGVVVGPDDFIYTASWDGQVNRIDPVTGAKERFSINLGKLHPHSLGFSPDGERLYIGTIPGIIDDTFGGTGPTGDSLFYIDADSNGSFDGEPKALSSAGGWHDAIGVDACGNLYVPDFFDQVLYRIAPNGQAKVLWTPPNKEDYVHGIVWGNDKGGWRSDAIYLPQSYNDNTVLELVIGVPSSEFAGNVINAIAPL
ncbi:MAG: hypothetical protein JKY56_03975 [Kofleriaceae bacterium]|nr:hypothetical protein [Kofleriaceae bacterium]